MLFFRWIKFKNGENCSAGLEKWENVLDFLDDEENSKNELCFLRN